MRLTVTHPLYETHINIHPALPLLPRNDPFCLGDFGGNVYFLHQLGKYIFSVKRFKAIPVLYILGTILLFVYLPGTGSLLKYCTHLLTLKLNHNQVIGWWFGTKLNIYFKIKFDNFTSSLCSFSLSRSGKTKILTFFLRRWIDWLIDGFYHSGRCAW